MKRYMTAVACLALASSAAVFAGEDNGGKYQAHQTLQSTDIDKLEGMDIYNSSGEQLGDVDEVVVDHNQQRMVVIGLEDSTKEVVIPINRLQLAGNGERLTTDFTRGELLALPDYDPMDMPSAEEEAE
jgi:sporulation protein YlmC with PRC-barrel domain